MIINDDRRKIRYYLSGFPGSAHDWRVYTKTRLFQFPNDYFGARYFLVGDSAFVNSQTIVTTFKAPRGHPLTTKQEQFNQLLGKLRVTSEHTIGILKARFPWLRSIPMKITDDPNSVRAILRHIECCVILHNLLIEDDDEIPQQWIDEFDDDTSDVAAMVGEYDYSAPIGDEHESDERRRRQMEYFVDMGLITA
jgi:hypothetical protein